MSFFMPQQALSMALEYVINQALRMNSGGNHALQALDQKALTLNLAELNFSLTFICHQEEFTVSGNSDSADCTITTSIVALKKIKENHALTQAIKDELLDIEGDLKVAQSFMAMAESIEIDWQSEVAKHIGDIPTYKLTQLAESISTKVNFASKQIKADASEWLVHEKQLVVTRSECQHFISQVDDVAEQVNQLSSRLTTLDQALLKP
ncbi:ubiquinone biosynthesis accessory factor UbiJ [Thalassotalea piscium]|uniref:Ubiquinone biosynthesis accessory factor UbiJ n=1 Tax=Thalassotalea piscium TaxID=1230533 RepID=A0A7X0NET6_9GAMM|nr:SCP2 sterol-binding domain-containing protein [Thalassotalea piscium]MBB6542090.1 ubiquinone biosynthesis protein UbiJ [Thalassotalea piscium]